MHAVVMIVGTRFVALLTAEAAQKFLAAKIHHDVQTAAEEVELTEAEILADLGRVPDRLDRLTTALERCRKD